MRARTSWPMAVRARPAGRWSWSSDLQLNTLPIGRQGYVATPCALPLATRMRASSRPACRSEESHRPPLGGLRQCDQHLQTVALPAHSTRHHRAAPSNIIRLDLLRGCSKHHSCCVRRKRQRLLSDGSIGSAPAFSLHRACVKGPSAQIRMRRHPGMSLPAPQPG